jgi:hypothetical protein
MNSTATHTSSRSTHLAQLTAALQKQVKLLKKENGLLKKQMDQRATGAQANEASSSGVVAKQICDNFSQSHMPTGSERPAESTRDINDLKVAVMTQVEKIKQLEQVLEELKGRKSRKRSVRSRSSSKSHTKSPHQRKSSTMEAPPSMMNQSKRDSHGLFNIF